MQFLGQVDEAELATAYASAAVSCLPSLNEAFGMVVVESVFIAVIGVILGLVYRLLAPLVQPIRIWFASNGVSPPGFAHAAQYRMASDPCSSRRASGVTTLPFDFDIFLRSGSVTKPEIAACAHGSEPCSRCAR